MAIEGAAQLEKIIPCPVCKEPKIFVDGNLDVEGQFSFYCDSRICKGKKRFINKNHLKKLLNSA